MPFCHQRVLEVTEGQNRGQKEVNYKNVPRTVFFCIHYQKIFQSIIGYVILTSEMIKGHWRSTNLKTWYFFKSPRDTVFRLHIHMIPLDNIGYDILISEVSRYHWRSRNDKMKLNLENTHRAVVICIHNYSYNIPESHEIYSFDFGFVIE